MEVRVFADDESTARAGAKFGPKGFGSNEWLTPRMPRTVTPELRLLRMPFAMLSSERMGTAMSEPPCRIRTGQCKWPACIIDNGQKDALVVSKELRDTIWWNRSR